MLHILMYLPGAIAVASVLLSTQLAMGKVTETALDI